MGLVSFGASTRDTIGEQVVLDINAEPDYAGGEVGFFIGTPQASGSDQCGSGNCCATLDRIKNGEGRVFYSQRDFNPDASTSGESFIHLLIYDSQIFSDNFYFAWEDIFGGSNNDFTDLVTSVSCSNGAAGEAGDASAMDPDAGSDDSCGCRMPGAASEGSLAAAIAFALGLFVSRRRRIER